MMTFRPACGPRSRHCCRGPIMSRFRAWMLKILLRKEVPIMAVVYATLIVKGKKTLDQVPSIIRKDVEDIIEALEVKL